jgi:hypothetical protein
MKHETEGSAVEPENRSRMVLPKLWMVLSLATVLGCGHDWSFSSRDAGADGGDAAEMDAESTDGGADAATSQDAAISSPGADSGHEAASPDTGATPAGEGGSPDAASAPDVGVPEASADAGCADGYEMKSGACQDIDECFEGTHQCHMTATCKNIDGGYDCTCPLGYSGGTCAGFACAPRIAVGGQHTCVLMIDGTVRCWGKNSHGQLGDGTQADHAAPASVNDLSDVVMISASEDSSCAVKTNGTLWCWGDNGSGQLGDGTTMPVRLAPVSVPHVDSIVAVHLGTDHACAVLQSGAVKCWGNNNEGQLGTGSSGSAMPTPVDVRDVSSAVNVYAGYQQSCAILRSGAVQCWGKGYLGDVSIASSLTPVDVEVPHSARAIAIGDFHVCSLHGDGSVYCWGTPGLLGLGSDNHDASPQRVPVGRARAIGVGIYTTFVLGEDGNAQWWGAGTAPAPYDGIDKALAMSVAPRQWCFIFMTGVVSCSTAESAPPVVGVTELW